MPERSFFFWATSLLWNVTIIQKALNISGSPKLGEGNREKKDDRCVTFYPISSKLTSARGRPSGQKATLFWASYLLKKVVTISVAAAKRSARASCTKTCTWKNKQAHFYNCLWNIMTPTFSKNIISNAILWKLAANCWGPLVKQMAIKCYPTYSTEAVV